MIDLNFLFWLGGLIVIIPLVIRQVNQYERGVVFTMGKYATTWGPGWHILIPVFQRLIKIDIRVKAIDVPNQEAITRDNVPIHINAVLYFKVKEAKDAVIEVEDFLYAVSQIAQTTMRNSIGEVTMDQLLSERVKIGQNIKNQVDTATDPWGIDVQSVELKDIILPEDLKRVIMKEAEAEREKRAVIIKAEGEVLAASNMAKAAHTLSASPGSLHLRTLQSINDMSSDKSNTTIWMVPIEALKALEGLVKNTGHKDTDS
jgi:regulator of protease activity HflC (stomatin/prohibitin superfamily)